MSWEMTKYIFVSTCKLLFVSPFVWIRNKTSKLFDTSVFTIGKKPNKD